MKTYQTYIHRRNDTGQVFYVGAGKLYRHKAKADRSVEWKAIAGMGYTIETVALWETQKEAWEHEIFLIACFRDLKHPLLNKAAGGPSSSGCKHSEETRKRVSESKRVENLSAETRHKMSIACKGKPISEARRAAIKAGWLKRKEKQMKVETP